jgi:hypothetical protein
MTRLMLKDRRFLGRNLRYVLPPSLCRFQGSLYALTDDYYQLYLEVQTASITYAIQSVLSGVHA